MKECKVYHTAVGSEENAIIKDNKVYLLGEDNELCLPKEMYLAVYECEEGLAQLVVEEKWGFVNIYTGDIVIEPIWDYAGPFYRGYAHVSLGVELEINHGYDLSMDGGKHGYIGLDGKIIIPLEYDYAFDIPRGKNFLVSIDGKHGIINNKNKIIIPLIWDLFYMEWDSDLIFCAQEEPSEMYLSLEDRLQAFISETKPVATDNCRYKWGVINDENQMIIPVVWDKIDTKRDENLIFCALRESCEVYIGRHDKFMTDFFGIEPVATYNYRYKWGVCHKKGNIIIKPELDEQPLYHKPKRNIMNKDPVKKYYILKKQRRYGILCNDGSLIHDITLYKKDAISIINELYSQ